MDSSMYDGLDNTFSDIGPGSVYPGQGGSTAMLATTDSPRIIDATPTGGSMAGGYSGNPIAGFVVFIVLVLLLMWVASKWGAGEGNFGNIKASTYNVLFVALVATTGIPAIKIAMDALARTGLPGANHVDAWAKAA